MYWFGRSDFVAAEAWWQRAIELEPDNRRALECLRLLEKTSSTGFKSQGATPFADPAAKRSTDVDPFRSSRDVGPLVPTGSEVEAIVPSEAPTPSEGLVAPPIPRRSDPNGLSTDPFDFVERGEQLYRTPSSIDSPPPEKTPNPWDDGPSRTSVVTVRSEGDFDAVPEPTPLPELDRERFFNRGDPKSREEIVDFLRATGDLPMGIDSSTPEEILFDDPIELASEEPTVAASMSGPPLGAAPEAEPPIYDAPPSTASIPEQKSNEALLEAARDRFQLHDFNGALEYLEQIPPDAPETEVATSLAASARQNLLKMYESKIGDFDHAPRVLISGEEVIWLNLNHRAGFILSQIDGAVTYEDLIALSGMPRLDTVRIIADLLGDKVIG